MQGGGAGREQRLCRRIVCAAHSMAGDAHDALDAMSGYGRLLSAIKGAAYSALEGNGHPPYDAAQEQPLGKPRMSAHYGH